MTLTKVKLERFTAFKKLDLEFSPGINVFVGDNGTGKTHLLKVCYAACDVSKTRAPFADKLIDLFLPSDRVLGRLVYRQKGSFEGVAEVFRDKTKLKISFSNHVKRSSSAKTAGEIPWSSSPIETVYIPVKEMLANAPGFLSLYAQARNPLRSRLRRYPAARLLAPAARSHAIRARAPLHNSKQSDRGAGDIEKRRVLSSK